MENILSELKNYQTALNTADIEDKEVFYDLFIQGMALLHLSDEDVALRFTMSRPSVDRWKNRRTAPHPVICFIVYKWFEEKVFDYILQIESKNLGY